MIDEYVYVGRGRIVWGMVGRGVGWVVDTYEVLGGGGFDEKSRGVFSNRPNSLSMSVLVVEYPFVTRYQYLS